MQKSKERRLFDTRLYEWNQLDFSIIFLIYLINLFIQLTTFAKDQDFLFITRNISSFSNKYSPYILEVLCINECDKNLRANKWEADHST